jgi:hypothetical protein
MIEEGNFYFLGIKYKYRKLLGPNRSEIKRRMSVLLPHADFNEAIWECSTAFNETDAKTKYMYLNVTEEEAIKIDLELEID